MKKLRAWLIPLFSILLVAALILGDWIYISNVRKSLWMLSVTDLKQVTAQASHSFEIYLHKDLQNVHGLAVIMAKCDSENLEYVETCLDAYNDISDGSVYSVINVDEGVLYSNTTDEFIMELSEERLEEMRRIDGSILEEPHISEINGTRVIACHESFLFADGTRGIASKTFPVARVVEEFTLSMYDGAGFSYIVNRSGDIMIRSIHRDSSHTYQNVFDAMVLESGAGYDNNDSVIGGIREAMSEGKSGVVRYNTENGVEFIYAFIPIDKTEGWYYINVVPSSVLMEQSNHILNISQLFICGTALGVLIIFVILLLVRRNLKAMRMIEREKSNREQLFDILTNSMGDAFVMISMQDRMVDYVSPNINYLLGIPANKIKEDARILITTEDTDINFQQKLSELEVGRSISYEQQRINHKTGEQSWFVITMYKVLIENDEKIIIVFSDRTAEKRREKDLEDATEIAEAANRAKSAFLSNMSHDIRTPMNAIIGLCTLIERDVDNPDMIHNHTRKMHASCQHLLGLINDVLDMSKIEAGKTSLNIEEINLAQIVEGIVTVMLPQVHAKSQTLDVSTFDVRSEHLMGDKLRINQILINILSNAIKYTPDGGNIELIIMEMPKKLKGFAHMRFIIKDNGMGISPEYIDSIFHAFTRETNSNMNKIQGTGLGMAITKSLVDLMEGNISVESELGKGSTFTVDLDLRIQEREKGKNFWREHNISDILIVDDDLDTCVYAASTMERVGVDAQYALNGKSAIDILNKRYESGKNFDLILMDLKMPDMDGVETTKYIRDNISKDVPVLAFTSYDWNDIEEKSKEAGITGFMSKPFFLTNLEMCIEKLQNKTNQDVQDNDNILDGKHILAAEDNEMNSEILRELLSMQGATCDIEENGEKVLERFKESGVDEYDFIFMDVQMPVMNGYEATKAIRLCNHPAAKTIPIIAMTADAFAEDVRHAIDAGMNAHMAKPLDIKAMKEVIKDIMAKNG